MAFDKDAFLTALDSMSVMDLNDLVKAIEVKFGVSAAAMSAPAAGGGGAAAAAGPAVGAATATAAAAADTPNFSSMSLMSCESSRTVSFETASRMPALASDMLLS